MNVGDKIVEIRARHERDNRYGDGLYPGAHKDRATLLTEVERLREALHRVSLASQNSMSSKDECGRIARETLEVKP